MPVPIRNDGLYKRPDSGLVDRRAAHSPVQLNRPSPVQHRYARSRLNGPAVAASVWHVVVEAAEAGALPAVDGALLDRSDAQAQLLVRLQVGSAGELHAKTGKTTQHDGIDI